MLSHWLFIKNLGVNKRFKMRTIQFALFFFVCRAALSRKFACSIEDEVCWDNRWKCFNPETHECLNDQAICEKGQGLANCGKNCYNPENEDCANGNFVCPKGSVSCSEGGQWQCYDPSSQVCTKSGAICPIGKSGCFWECYDPEKQTCQENTGVTCDIGLIPCGFSWQSKCLVPDGDEKCSSDGRTICKKDEESCGHQCYSPESGQKCFKELVLCQAGEENCGWECYDPTIQKCHDDSLICDSDQEPCGKYSCYWPQNETCHGGEENSISLVCSNDQKACGFNCYDPAEKYCQQAGTDDWKFDILCELDEQVCGYGCYQPNDNEECVDGVVCKKGSQVCGGVCYEEISGFTCYEDRVLCPEGKEGCGWQCIDPKEKKCVDTAGKQLLILE